MKFLKVIKITAILLMISLTFAFAQDKKQDLKPVDIKLPKPMFIGTPQNMQVPNLEKPLGKARPPFPQSL